MATLIISAIGRGSRTYTPPPLDTPLIDAASAGDLASVKKMLESGNSVEERDRGGWSPFIHACLQGHLEVAKLLHSKGAPVDDLSGSGRTGLTEAAYHGDMNVVKWLVENGATVDLCKNPEGITPLWLAISSGHLDVAAYLMDHGADYNHVNQEKTPLLIHACHKNSLPEIELLVSRGAYLPFLSGTHVVTPFWTACLSNNFELLKYFGSLEGFDVNEKDRNGNTALAYAIARSNLGLIKALFELGAKHPEAPADSPLLLVRDIQVLNYLVDEQHWSLNVFSSKGGHSPLSKAAEDGRLELVMAMIEKGANPNATAPGSTTTAYDRALWRTNAPRANATDYKLLEYLTKVTSRK